MKKTSKIKKIAVTMMAAVCALSPLAAISASAASDYTQKKSVKLTNGYTVRATLTTNTTKANTKFEVTNGGSTDLKTKIIVSYKNKNNKDIILNKTKATYSAYLFFNMPKADDFKRYNKVEAYYFHPYLPSTYSNHEISLYKYI